MSEKVRLTRAGYNSLKAELERLSTTGRDEIRNFMNDVMEEGDLSENSGYDDARQKMGLLETRIFELENIIAKAEIVADGGNKVGLGATVKIQMGTIEREFLIVSTHEADPQQNKISDISDMGAALMDKSVGEKVSVRGREVVILEVRF
ncbi:MAG: transcription elongation factor GreA [Deinococcales bacterium]